MGDGTAHRSWQDRSNPRGCFVPPCHPAHSRRPLPLPAAFLAPGPPSIGSPPSPPLWGHSPAGVPDLEPVLGPGQRGISFLRHRTPPHPIPRRGMGGAQGAQETPKRGAAILLNEDDMRVCGINTNCKPSAIQPPPLLASGSHCAPGRARASPWERRSALRSLPPRYTPRPAAPPYPPTEAIGSQTLSLPATCATRTGAGGVLHREPSGSRGGSDSKSGGQPFMCLARLCCRVTAPPSALRGLDGPQKRPSLRTGR